MQLLLSSVCMALTSAVIGFAYYQKQQFYPAVVYITKSNASMGVIYIQFFVIVFMFGKLISKIFLGTLRAAEFEHLLERFWYALTETCLAFTVFRDDFNPRFVALFTVLLFLKSFHWLAEERVDFMERSPVLGWLFHIRVGSLLTVLGILDYVLLIHAYNSTLVRGPTVQMVFGFEYAILLTVIASTAIKYVLHAAEMRTDTPWENKAVFLLYTELVIGLIKVVLYLLFVVIMAKIYALPMFVFRPMFFTLRNFRKALNDVIMSRRAIRNMNTLYPDATPEELRQSDNICIICREDMVNHSKKLPCGHIFHTTCLRSWFQRQQTCPTCRLNILRTPTVNSTAMPRQADEAAAAAAGNPIPAAAGAQPAGGVPPPAPVAVDGNQARANGNLAGGQALPPNFADLFGDATGLPNGLPNLAGLQIPPPPVMPMLSPFMMPPHFGYLTPLPPPPMPQDLTNFTDEELRAMEGHQRDHIVQRLKLLQNINLMLDSAGIMMSQYQSLAARLQLTAATPASAANGSAGSSVYDMPSTSATAMAQMEAHQVTPTAATSAPSPTMPIEKVTIEDLGADADEDDIPSTATEAVSIPNSDADFEENSSELGELRKRRLKFLEERNKPVAANERTSAE
ncbi:E3 ubiquitin-protein ligase HRD1 [Drosophila santomea]|uniref:E3 ubiquitin-protein ligase HRD1 n=1 Tax=Drosophila santomea TaxID=129105 RepID=UPI0019537FFA|nr:E3 ubiquitin-protein ligase HRD1 [Drosophila santomea]XP_039490777.1 E3 ubiquitin-protein ligase HRD1 [Drosophila santomea]XP_039490778.1 E3 ubiquitin-protein ligase HRD1 [Drosophila santomea]XP_039490779.1 E3 ubiquitin-protein ligase HRD1 [Drosophila santomea]